MARSKRDHLLNIAGRLFNRGGFHATGIDAILSQAGVAKMTLYKHFRSKDDLIIEVLRRYDGDFRMRFSQRVRELSESPNARLLSVFDALSEWVCRKDFHGCLFAAAAAEFPSRRSLVRAACVEQKRWFFEYLRQLAIDDGASDPDKLARSLALLVEGAMALTHVGDRCDAARDAHRAAETLIEADRRGG